VGAALANNSFFQIVCSLVVGAAYKGTTPGGWKWA